MWHDVVVFSRIMPGRGVCFQSVNREHLMLVVRGSEQRHGGPVSHEYRHEYRRLDLMAGLARALFLAIRPFRIQPRSRSRWARRTVARGSQWG
jgi:hypothetical protein